MSKNCGRQPLKNEGILKVQTCKCQSCKTSKTTLQNNFTFWNHIDFCLLVCRVLGLHEERDNVN